MTVPLGIGVASAHTLVTIFSGAMMHVAISHDKKKIRSI